MKQKQVSPLAFFSRLLWLDGKPLVIEPYRREDFRRALYTFDDDGRPTFNLALIGRAKKNWKTGNETFGGALQAARLEITGRESVLPDSE